MLDWVITFLVLDIIAALLGIGISAFLTTEHGQLTFAIDGFLGLTLCSILAMLPAGYIAGKLARPFWLKRKTGELHGISAWTIALIVSILLCASLAQFINQSSYVVTRKPVDIRLTYLNNDNVYRLKQGEATAVTEVEINPEKAADAAAMATFSMFFIFIIGLLAAAFGGRIAMMCAREELEKGHHCEKCNQ